MKALKILTRMSRQLVCVTAINLILSCPASALSLQLATVCDLNKIDINNYYVSEKFDGVRAYWDGKQFYSRQGHAYHAPQWFTQNLPKLPLDGELWLGRLQFEALLSIVKQQTPDQRWRQIRYQVFDLPSQDGTFSERFKTLQTLPLPPQANAVKQQRFNQLDALLKYLEESNKQGSEGLMLHHKAAYYSQGRNPLLCKLKSYSDAEATVIAYTAGKGKYRGMTGALVVKDANGLIFKIGTGLSDKLRRHPPKIGVLITYRYNGLTLNGLPRFARFMRIRQRPTPD